MRVVWLLHVFVAAWILVFDVIEGVRGVAASGDE
jgi:hypothetical protein